MKVLLALALSMCLGACEPESMAIPPWLMWGNTDKVHAVSAGASGQGTTQQLVRINYARPETWRFFLAAQLLDSDVAAGGTLIVAFQTTLGIGRASVTVPLGVFNFVTAGAFPKEIKFASTSLGPVVDDAQAAIPNLLDTVVAQDIQVQAQVVLAAPAGKFADVNCTALFAPEGHVRPEWFKGEFPGREHEGR
jgi:hypothetical protein